MIKSNRVGVSIAGLILLAACGGGSVEIAKEPPAPKNYTAAQLQAALPAVKDVPGGIKISERCPGGANCTKVDDGAVWSVNVALEEQTGSELQDFAMITVYQSSTLIAAEQGYERSRSAGTPYVGSFETKPKDNGSRGYDPGLKGTGTRDDTTISGWPGFVAERSMAFVSPGGKVSDGKIRDGQVRVRQGRVTVSAFVSVNDEGSTPGAVTKLGRRLVEEYLTRLN